MRRRPIAVYRVIDEEELLGGDGIDVSYGAADPPVQPLSADGAPARPVAWRERSADWKGWATTAVGVVALAGVAVLLLSVSTHARALVAASATSPRIRSTRRPPQRIWRVVPAAASARVQATRRATRRGRLRAGHRSRPPRRVARAAVAARRLVLGAGASRPAAAPGPAASAQPVPDQEFGFER
jgi:hypothetical protein